MDEEKNLDELWALTDDGTPSVDEADSELSEQPTGEAEGTETGDATNADAETSSEDDLDARLEAKLAALLPRYRDEWTRDVMNRTRQSMTDRDNQIKAQLAPVWELLRQQAATGYLTEDDAKEQYAQQYRQMHAQAEANAQQQAQAELYQQWLAQQQPQQQQETRPEWALSIESRMNNILAESGLTDADPELKKVPLQITNPNPGEALAHFELAVATAKREKESRLARNPTRPKKERPFVDMGMGGSAARDNPLSGKEDIDELWNMAGV